MTESDDKTRLRRKNIAVGLALVGLVALFYFVTIVRIGDNLQ